MRKVKTGVALCGVIIAACAAGGDVSETGREGLATDFATQGGWSFVDNYKNRLRVTFGGELGGEKGLLLTGNFEKSCDTQWIIVSPRVRVEPSDRSYAFSFEITSERMLIGGFTGSFMDWNKRRNVVRFYAKGKPVLEEEFTFVLPGGRARLDYAGAVPAGVDEMAVQFGINRPNIKQLVCAPRENFLVSNFRLAFSAVPSELPRVGLLGWKRLPFNVPTVTLREDGAVLRDGKPFFPIGLYNVRTNVFNSFNWDVALRQMKTNGFNMAQSYHSRHDPAFLAALERNGMTTFMHVESVPYKTFGAPGPLFWKEGRSPSILSWYTGDDTMRHTTPEEFMALYASIRSIDARRIVSHAERFDGTGVGMSALGLFAPAQDVFQPEIYPIVEGTPVQVSNCVARVYMETRASRESLMRGDPGRPKSVWPIVQYFAGGHYRRVPTDREERAMTFAALAGGANGLLWYEYGYLTAKPERWAALAALAREVAEWAPILLVPSPAQPSAPQILAGPAEGPLRQPTIVYLYKTVGEKGYLLTVNTTMREVSASFALENRASARVWRENRSLSLDGNRLCDRWQPFAVHCYELEK